MVVRGLAALGLSLASQASNYPQWCLGNALKVDDKRGFGDVNAGIDKLCLHEILLLVFGV
jgi:hypothetical protein